MIFELAELNTQVFWSIFKFFASIKQKFFFIKKEGTKFNLKKPVFPPNCIVNG